MTTREALLASMDWRQWEAHIAEWLEIAGFEYIHIRDARRQHVEGVPDYLAFRGERKLAIECKTGHSQLRPKQRAWRDILLAAGFEYYAARPVHGDMLKAAVYAGITTQDLVRGSILRDARLKGRHKKSPSRAND